MEIKLLEDSFLLSETDEKGIIRYVNDEFCEFSEYSIEELLGKPQRYAKTGISRDVGRVEKRK
jgi:aerotaxis receptor